MAKELLIFENPAFGQVRSYKGDGDEVFFCAVDICRALGYGNSREALRKHVEEDDVTKRDTIDNLGRKQYTSFINESGLYSLILSSKLPKAREFKHWVTAVVLPQIRKTGGYIPVKEDDTPEELMARALLVAKETIEKKDVIIAQKNEQLNAQRPKVLFADAVTSQEDSILISEMAKLLTQNGYEIGRTRFFRWLRENGYIFKHSTEPIQKWVERGIFDTHVTIINTNHGQREAITTKVTGKGQQYFINLFIR